MHEKKRYARMGAPSLTCRFDLEICGSISLERLVSVDAEINYLGALDFSPLCHSPAINGVRRLVGTRRIIAHLLPSVRKIRYLNGLTATIEQ